MKSILHKYKSNIWKIQVKNFTQLKRVRMSDDNSSSDEEFVVGHMFDDLINDLFGESGSDSSDDSSSDDSSDDSSSDDSRGGNQAMGPWSWPFGPQPMQQGPQRQGPQHLASDPRYIWSDAVTSVKAEIQSLQVKVNCDPDLFRNYANGPISNLQRVIDSLFTNAEVSSQKR